MAVSEPAASIRLLGLSGSLRAASTNTAMLHAAAAVAPPGVSLIVFDGIGDLPIFNPDLDPDAVAAVLALSRCVAEADALVFACPEYARGVPGGLKNALDWLVAGDAIPGKRFALFRASPRAVVAPASLVLTLRTMSALPVPEADVVLPLLGSHPSATRAILDRPASREALRQALERLVHAVTAARAGGPDAPANN